MAQDDKIKALYNQLKNDGYQLDDENTFRQDLEDDASFREQIYNAQKNDGYDMGGDFSAWQQRLMGNFGGQDDKATGTATQNGTNVGRHAQQVVDEYYRSVEENGGREPQTGGKNVDVYVTNRGKVRGVTLGKDSPLRREYSWLADIPEDEQIYVNERNEPLYYYEDADGRTLTRQEAADLDAAADIENAPDRKPRKVAATFMELPGVEVTAESRPWRERAGITDSFGELDVNNMPATWQENLQQQQRQRDVMAGDEASRRGDYSKHGLETIKRGNEAAKAREMARNEKRNRMYNVDSPQKAERLKDIETTMKALNGDERAMNEIQLKTTSVNAQLRDRYDYARMTGKELKGPVLDMTQIGIAPKLERDEKGNVVVNENGTPLVGNTTNPVRVNTQKAESERVEREDKERQIKVAEEELKKLIDEARQIESPDYIYMQDALSPFADPRTTNASLRELSIAIKNKQEQIAGLRRELEGGNKDFIQGLADSLTDLDNITFGLNSLDDNLHTAIVSQRMRNGAKPGKYVQMMLDAMYKNNEVQQRLDENSTRLYRVGGITGYMMPFIAQITATGGFSAVADIGKGLGLRWMERFASKYGMDTLKKRMTANVIKGLGIGLGDIGAGFVNATTLGLGNTVNDALQRGTGQLGVNGKGEYEFTGADEWWRATLKAVTSQTKEFATELFGGHLPGLRRLNVTLAKQGPRARAVSRALSGMAGTPAMRKVAKWLRRGGINGLGGEILEEEIGLPVDVALGDMTWEEAMSGRTQGDIILGIPMSIGAMYSVGLGVTSLSKGYNTVQYLRYKDRLDSADKTASSRLTDDVWQPLKSKIDGTANDGMGTLWDEIRKDDNLDVEEKRSVYDYVNTLMSLRGYNLGMMFNVREAARRKELFVNIQPTGKGEFGDEYDQFKGNAEDAAMFLVTKKGGVAKGVFKRKGVGDIDLAWGNPRGGLEHIIEKHVITHSDFESVESAMDQISDVIKNGKISLQRNGNYAVEKNGVRVILSKAQDGHFVVTAYDNTRNMESKRRNDADATRLRQSIFNNENGTPVSQSTTPGNKDSETFGNWQENDILSPEERANVHDDGMIHAAVLYPDAQQGNEAQEVFITKGNVVMNADGTIDTEASDKEIYYKGADGQVHLTSPDKLQSVAQPISVEDYVAANRTDETDLSNETNEADVAEEYAPGQVVNVNVDGQTYQATVQGSDGNGNVLVFYQDENDMARPATFTVDEIRDANRPNNEEPAAGGVGAVDVSEYFGNAEEAMATAQDIIQNGEIIGTLPDGRVQMQKDGFVVTLMPDGNGGVTVTAIERTGNNEPQNIPENGNIGDENIPQNGGISTEDGKISDENFQRPQEIDANAMIDRAREGDQEAQTALQSYGIDWGKKGVYRFAAKGEVDNILAGGKYNGRFDNGRVDATNSDTPTTAATGEYRITFKDGFDFNKTGTPEADRAVMKNAELGDGYVTGGYTLDDVARIERRNNDGTYETVYDANLPIGRPLTAQEAEAVVTEMETMAEAAPELELTPENWIAEFGEDGIVNTPIGQVKQGDNQYLKLAQQGRNGKLGMVKPTLEHPSIIIEDERPSKDGKSERDTSYVFIKTFIKGDGTRYYYFTSVTVRKDGREVVISSQERSANRISKLLQQGKVAWIDTAFSLHPMTQIGKPVSLNDSNKPTTAGSRPALLGVNSPELSESKDSANNRDLQEFAGKKGKTGIAHVPQDAEGNPIYDQAPVEATIADLYDGSLNDEEVQGFIDANITEAQKKYDSVQKKAPKIGTNKAKYLEQKRQWQADVDEAKRVLDYWNEVNNAKESITHTTPQEVEAAQAELSGQNAREEYEGDTEQGTEVSTGVQGTVEDGAVPEETNRGENKEYQLSETNTQSEQVGQDNIRAIDPRSMSTDERQRRGDMLRNAPAIEVKAEQIVSTPELSARKAAERWWNENVPEPVFYDTEVGEVEINKNSVESSLAHRYGQAKLDAITSLVEGFENAVYLGTLPDSRERGVVDHYFAYPIIYNGKRCYVFCRAMQDANKNRPYVHEVFVAENIKRGDTLQTAASKPHGGIALYKDILGNVLEETPEQQSLLDGNNPRQYPANRELSESKDKQTSVNEQAVGEKIAEEEAKVEQNPTEAQKEAGNYKKGHVKIDGYDVTIENPKGSVRSGVDRNGQEWSVTMNNTYGYIRGTEGVDGDHIDVFLSDDPTQGDVYVIDQLKDDGSFDEHKVMYGFNSAEEARDAYLANYSPGWKGLGTITKVSKEEFKKWIDSSHRKTKPFAEYKSVNKDGAQNEGNTLAEEAHESFSGIMAKSTHNVEINDNGVFETGNTLYAPITVDGKGTNLSLYQEEPAHSSGEPIVGVSFYRNGMTYQEAADLSDEYNKYVGEKVCTDGSDELAINFGSIDDAVRFEEWLNDNGGVRFRIEDDGGKALSAEEVAIRDAVLDRLRESGLEVITDTEKGQMVLDEANGRGEVRKRKRLSETATWQAQEAQANKATAFSDSDGAKILKNLDNLVKKYENRSSNRPRTLIEDISDALRTGSKTDGRDGKSFYKTFKTENGNLVTVRLSNHNADVSNFDRNGEREGISIVISNVPSKRMNNNGNAHVIEYYYPKAAISKAYGKPQVEIISSVKDAIKTGRYNDTTGLAEVEEVNGETIREHRVYHGSGADFDRFDHSHIGEGEGAQAYGWGSYVTEVEGIGRAYAESMARRGGHITYDGEKLGDVLDNEYYFDETWRNWKRHLLSATTAEDLKNRILNLYFFPKGKGTRERKKAFEQQKKELLADIDNGRIKVDLPRHIYTVEIPDDTGENYLDWYEPVTKEQQGKIYKQLRDEKTTLEGATADFWNGKSYVWDSGREFYSFLDYCFIDINDNNNDSQKAASEFLSRAGFTGIKYPAQYRSGGREDGAKNYVIFNENDLKITDHVRFFRTPNGEAYGFTVGGKIYIDPRIATAETPIHEYAHLWASAQRQGNPEEWRNVVRLMKDTPVWDEVKHSYPELTTDDELADEVLAMYSGRRGAERLKEEMRKAVDGKTTTEAARAVTAIGRVKEALRKFWKDVADFLHIHYTSAEEVADRVMSDLLEGSPLHIQAQGKDVRYRFIGEQGAARLDAAEEATTRLDNLDTARRMEQVYNDKKARIEKLRNSKPVEITGEEIEPSDNLKQYKKNALEYGKKLQGSYVNKDTGRTIQLQRGRRNGGINEVLQHDYKDVEHLQSVAAIPQIIENSIYIDSRENTDKEKNPNVVEYQYYVCGLKIGNTDYTVRSTIAVDNKGNRYYDHKLTSIEKGKLLDQINDQTAKNVGFGTTPGTKPTTDNSLGKDKVLVSLLQTSDQENARKIKLATGWERGADGKWRYETPDFEYHPNGDARQNDKYKDNDWYKELYDLEERLFNGETLTDEETRRFDELAARENEIRDNDKNTEHVYLDDYVKDDELFKAYPELKQTKVDFVDLPSAEYSAKYNPEENRITVNQAKSIDIKSVLAHEIQHAIQRIEGFASGGNSRNGQYNNLSGEVEARNVQERLNMTPEQRRKTLAEETEDVAREDQQFLQDTLGTSESNRTAPKIEKYESNLEDVNERFNQQLEGLTEENADKVTLSLGRPSAALRAAGVEDKPMKLYGNKVIKKMKKHGFTLAELKDLPRAVADPIAVFNNYQKNGNRSILTELRTANGNFLVTVDLGKGEKDIDFNIVSSVFGKPDNKIINWINKGFATYINKEKAQSYLYYPAPIAETPKSNELVSAANIVRNFENPNVLEENLAPTEQTNDIDTAVADMAGKLNIGVRVAHSVDEVGDEGVRRAIEKGRNVKGWYDTRTGEIVVYAPNATDVDDAVRTVLHEGVAHYGLRQLVGEENFDTFLDNIYNNVAGEIKAAIDEKAQRNGWSTRVATEEYLASLAEDTNFEEARSSGLWQKIKDFFMDLLTKAGIRLNEALTDNELRYLLWRSYENLQENGGRDIVATVKDIAKQHELGVGNYSPSTFTRGETPAAEGWMRELGDVNERFNEELKRYQNGGMNKNEMFHLGMPQGVMRMFLPDLPIVIRQRIMTKGSVKKHHIDPMALKNMPRHLSEPIFVFRRADNVLGVLTEMKDRNGKNVFVAISLSQMIQNGKNVLEVNDIRSIHGRNEADVIYPIVKNNTLVWADKEKGLAWLSSASQSVQQEIDKQDLVSAANIVRNFENPSVEGEKNDGNVRLREAEENDEGTTPTSTYIVDAWDRQVKSDRFKLVETGFDYLNAVDKFQKLIEKHSGKEIKSFENAYDAMTFLSSKNREEMDMFESFFVTPLNRAIQKLIGKKDGLKKWDWSKGPLRELVMYVEAKHGTERNRQMAVEAVAKADEKNSEAILNDWAAAKKRINGQEGTSRQEKQRLLDEAAASLGADLSKDYSGLSSVFGDKNVYPKGWQEESLDYVSKYESGHEAGDINGLWTAIGNATGFALQKQYETGLVSREYVERQKERFDNYIPLRGFEDEIAGDVYSYLGHDFYPGSNPVKTAHGRTSEPGNPFGSILNTAYASISSGNKNVAKTALYSLVVNHDTGGLAVAKRAWMVKYADLKNNPELESVVVSPKIEGDEDIPEWVEAVPRIQSGASVEDINRMLGNFEEVMKKYQKEDVTKPIGKKVKIAYKTLYNERNEHDIPLFIAGDKYIITITGNPRVAQAMNGLLNPDSGEENTLTEYAKKTQRFMSGAFTAKNAAFSFANLAKDTIYANNQTFIRENPKYWLKFTENQRLGFGDFIPMMRRLKRYRDGKLDLTKKRDRMFKEFMENGGATGYTFVNTQEEYAKELAKKLDELSRKTPKALSLKGLWNIVFDTVEFMGQAAELVNRFAAYKTSREMGRTVNRSIRDAKEITVNFNRKGAGRKTADKNNKWYINLAAATSQYGRTAILFWNANMQAKYRFFKNIQEHPIKTSVTLIANSMAIGGAIIPFINNLALPALYEMFGIGGDDGDDDDDDYYNALTDWERTHNICLRLPKGYWLKIPLSPEMTPWYSMGDAIGGAASGQRDLSAKDFMESAIDAVSPLSINWSYSGSQMLLNALPTVGQPLFQNMMNVNFMGSPIKKTPFTRRQGKNPEYTMVYRSASPTLVELSRLSNRILGGEDDKTAGEWRDWNPAMVQNLISGYAGGYGTTALSIADWIVNTWKGEKQAVTFSKMPFVSRFVIGGNKDVKLQRINSRYNDVMDFVDDFEFDMGRYEKRIEDAQDKADPVKLSESMSEYDRLLSGERFEKYNELYELNDSIKYYEDYLKEFPDDEVTQNLLYNLKQTAIEILKGGEKKKDGQ